MSSLMYLSTKSEPFFPHKVLQFSVFGAFSAEVSRYFRTVRMKASFTSDVSERVWLKDRPRHILIHRNL